MNKTIIHPLDRPFARGVAVEMDGLTRVYLSGVAAYNEGDVQDQTRGIFDQLDDYLAAVDGGLEDLVRVRVYLNKTLTDEEYDAVNEIRHEYFPDETHYPASTLVEVAGLVSDEFLIEIDAEAIIPHDEWDVDIIK